MKTIIAVLFAFVGLFGADTESFICREPFDLHGFGRLDRTEKVRDEIRSLTGSDNPVCARNALRALGLMGDLEFLTSRFSHGEGELSHETYSDKLATMSEITMIAMNFKDERVGKDALLFMKGIAVDNSLPWWHGASEVLGRSKYDSTKIFTVTMLSRLGTEDVEKFLLYAKESGVIFGKGRLVDVLDAAIEDNSKRAFEYFFHGLFSHRMP